MAERDVAAWRAEFKRIHPTEASDSGPSIPRQRFVGRVMKLKLSGSKRSTLITIFGGPSSPLPQL